ncbi:MAG: tyrosine-type recombinase/integrase [Candidatus Dadabacteria bacterium]|nr:MAG: tyrosine-type recombinase/integrase [Candidatus Dadabacteria bacterium]
MIKSSVMDELIRGFTGSLRRRETTKETYGKALREFSKWLGGTSPSVMTPDDIQRYKDYIISKRLSPTSMSAYLTAVRRFYDYLVSTGAVGENPARRVKGAPRPRRHLTDPISRRDVSKLMNAVDTSSPLGRRDAAILGLMVRAGLSEIEIVRLNLGDLKYKGGQRVIYVQGKSKDRKDEYVSVTPPMEETLVKYLEERGESPPDEPLFRGIGNRAVKERISTRGLRARIDHYFESAGIKKKGITPASLRHTAAMLAIEEGATVSEVQRLLRLRTPESALQYFEEAKELTRKQF